MIPRILCLLLLASSALIAQLTPEQKSLDLQTIASLYAKQYGAYEWKRDNLGFDLFNLRPWTDRARQTKSDLEYLELVAEYVASLQDLHSFYSVNSDFSADLHIYTDIYDGKVLIEQISRAYLPASRYDFAVGDEVLQFDGKPVMEVIQGIASLNSFGNPRSTARNAADLLAYRAQAYLPRAAELGDNATLLIRRANGSEKSYSIPWDKSGTPLLKLGPLPNLRLTRAPIRVDDEPLSLDDPPVDAPVQTTVPAYYKPWLSLQRHISARPLRSLRGFSARDPIYRLPANFVQRLGRVRSDYFFSGTVTQNSKRIGFIRIGTFDLPSYSLVPAAVRQFAAEIAFMKANTDVLIVDVTRNGGGFGCYAEELETYLIPNTFTAIGREIRPNLEIIRDFESAVLDAIEFGEEWEVNSYKALLKDLKTAYSENRGRTGSIPLCSSGLEREPARDRAGAVLAYNKPILLLTDEFAASASELFAAVLQDAGSARLFGYRTAGGGGNIVSVNAGFFSEGSTSLSQMLSVRPKMQSSPGFPASAYIENVGVKPEIDYDFQTKENLLTNGAPFVDTFLKAAIALLPN